jgi:hypothetical protein
LTFYIAELTQSFLKLEFERLSVGESYVKRTYSRPLVLLRTCRKRPGHRYSGSPGDELAPSHRVSRDQGQTDRAI